MSIEFEPAINELAIAKDPPFIREPESWQIQDVLWQIMDKLGNSPITYQADSTGWWEAYSHGLAQPIEGFSNPERGFLARCKNVERYIQLETDFLHFDDQGFCRNEDGDPTGKPISFTTNAQLKALALRIVTFLQTRKELAAQGFILPDNPNLAEAINVVRDALTKDKKSANQFQQLFNGLQLSTQTNIASVIPKKVMGL